MPYIRSHPAFISWRENERIYIYIRSIQLTEGCHGINVLRSLILTSLAASRRVVYIQVESEKCTR